MSDPETRPDDLVDYDEAARMVDRGRSTIRGWVREGQLRSWPAEEGRQNARRLVSRAELQVLVASSKTAHPGGPGRGEPGPSVAETELRVQMERVEGLKAALEAERARGTVLEALVREAGERARAEAERAHVERLRAAEWHDRATALEAEVQMLRQMAGQSWWQRLLGTRS